MSERSFLIASECLLYPYFHQAIIRDNGAHGESAALCDALERLHGQVPTAVIPDDDPWKLALGRALDGLTGKISNTDVWHLPRHL
jgi:hypothetical protein